MDLFKDFIVPMAIQTVVIWAAISAVVIFIYYKGIPDVKKRKKIITGYLFISLSIISSILIIVLGILFGHEL